MSYTFAGGGGGGGGAVDSVDGQTGDVDLAGSYLPLIYSASVDPGGVIGSWTVSYTTNATTSSELFQIYANSVKTFWFNENGNPRSKAAKAGEAALKLFANGTNGADQTAHIMQVYAVGDVPADGTPAMYVDRLGWIHAPNHKANAWQTLTAGDADYTAETSGGTGYVPGCRLEGPENDIVRLRGRFSITNTVLSDVLTTLPSGYHPARRVDVQLGNNAATAITASINTNGTIVINRAVTSAGFVSLDGITFPISA